MTLNTRDDYASWMTEGSRQIGRKSAHACRYTAYRHTLHRSKCSN